MNHIRPPRRKGVDDSGRVDTALVVRVEPRWLCGRRGKLRRGLRWIGPAAASSRLAATAGQRSSDWRERLALGLHPLRAWRRSCHCGRPRLRSAPPPARAARWARGPGSCGACGPCSAGPARQATARPPPGPGPRRPPRRVALPPKCLTGSKTFRPSRRIPSARRSGTLAALRSSRTRTIVLSGMRRIMAKQFSGGRPQTGRRVHAFQVAPGPSAPVHAHPPPSSADRVRAYAAPEQG